MRMLKLCAALAAITPRFTVAARAAAPGEWGQYMYWKQGRCVTKKPTWQPRECRRWCANKGRRRLIWSVGPATHVQVSGEHLRKWKQ
jgi:hypothetical protein